MKRIAYVLLLCWPIFLFANENTRLLNMKAEPSFYSSRFIFSFSKKPHGRVRYLAKPDRVVLELLDTAMDFKLQNPDFAGSNVRGVDTQIVDNSLLFVFKTKGKAKWKINLPKEEKNQLSHLQLEIQSKTQIAKQQRTNLFHKIHEQHLEAANNQREIKLIDTRLHMDKHLNRVFQKDFAKEFKMRLGVKKKHTLNKHHYAANKKRLMQLACNHSGIQCLNEKMFYQGTSLYPSHVMRHLNAEKNNALHVQMVSIFKTHHVKNLNTSLPMIVKDDLMHDFNHGTFGL